jgi:hypothetical protein
VYNYYILSELSEIIFFWLLFDFDLVILCFESIGVFIFLLLIRLHFLNYVLPLPARPPRTPGNGGFGAFRQAGTPLAGEAGTPSPNPGDPWPPTIARTLDSSFLPGVGADCQLPSPWPTHPPGGDGGTRTARTHPPTLGGRGLRLNISRGYKNFPLQYFIFCIYYLKKTISTHFRQCTMVLKKLESCRVGSGSDDSVPTRT